ncbi:MAG: S1/P1 nuclease [Burkholderiaceae bacterium]
MPASRFPKSSSIRIATALWTFVAITSWSVSAFAWSARGHAMVADIATQFLTPTTKATVADLLRGDLNADGKPSGRETLGQVASWPDELRATPEQRATGVYHYDDVPICGVPDRAKYCPDGKCATAWFARQIAILEDRSQPHLARNEALKWITHLVGDLHQPLHASDHDDKGGNDVRITFLGKASDDRVEGRPAPSPYNLHTAWDRLIPYRMFDERGGYEKFLADRPDADTRQAWNVGDIDLWANESFVLARDFIYPSLPTTFQCEKPITAVVPIGVDYYRPASEIAAMQLRKAGVRLAKILNGALDAP